MDRTYLFCPTSESIKFPFLLEENLNRMSSFRGREMYSNMVVEIWHWFRKLSCAAKKREMTMKATYIFTCTSTYRSTFRSCTKSDLKSPSSEPTSSSKASSKGSSRSPWASQDQESEKREESRENKTSFVLILFINHMKYHSHTIFKNLYWARGDAKVSEVLK